MSREDIKNKIYPVLKRFNVKRAALFGSLARGDFESESDIDLLVDLPDEMSLLDVISLKIELEEVLGKKVDLVEYSAIKPNIKESILKDELLIYGA